MQHNFSRTLVVTAAFLVVVAANASAQGGINLSWSDCDEAAIFGSPPSCRLIRGDPRP